jgi:putative transposase
MRFPEESKRGRIRSIGARGARPLVSKRWNFTTILARLLRTRGRDARAPVPVKSNVRQIIQDKRAYHTQACPEEEAKGFRGWHSRGYLPHFDVPGVIQFITFRLDDALPASRRSEWEALLQSEDERTRRIRIESYLDKGYGACYLKNHEVATMIQNALLFFDGERYRLCAWAVMPNHVHALAEIWEIPLSDVIWTWKSYTAKKANRLLSRSGDFWQKDYFDRYIRDEDHFRKAIHYIEWNPVKAHLVKTPDEWAFSSAQHKSAGVPPASCQPPHSLGKTTLPNETS